MRKHKVKYRARVRARNILRARAQRARARILRDRAKKQIARARKCAKSPLCLKANFRVVRLPKPFSMWHASKNIFQVWEAVKTSLHVTSP